MEKTMQERVMNAAMRYMVMKGCETLDELDNVLVFKDKGDLVFAEVNYRDRRATSFKEVEEPMQREDFERVSLEWLAEHDETDVAVRFDKIALIVVADDRAMLKHHTNCMEKA